MTAAAAQAVMPPGLLVQPRAARTLSRMLERRSGHAYLLSGSRGAGTVEAASWLASSLLCPAGGGDGCETCRRVERRVHPDLIWLEAEGLQLRDEQVRSMAEQLTRKPFEAHMQVAVIDDAETLGHTNASTGNRLLKVLEEPSGDVVFVLLASQPSLVLPTIRSRVVEVPFLPLPDGAMRDYLEHAGIAEAARAGLGIDQVVRLAAGDITRARDFACGGPALERHQVVTRIAAAICATSIAPHAAAAELLAVPAAAEQAAVAHAEREFEALIEQMAPKEGQRFRKSRDHDGMEARVKRRGRRAMTDELRATLGELAAWYRDLMAISCGAGETVVFADCREQLERLVHSPAAQSAVAAIDAIEELPFRLATNVDQQIALDALCAELVSLAEGRIRYRRTLGAPARSPQGLDLSVL